MCGNRASATAAGAGAIAMVPNATCRSRSDGCMRSRRTSARVVMPSAAPAASARAGPIGAAGNRKNTTGDASAYAATVSGRRCGAAVAHVARMAATRYATTTYGDAAPRGPASEAGAEAGRVPREKKDR